MALPQIREGDRVVMVDAFGEEHHGKVTFGPSWSRHGERGAFEKYWIVRDGRTDEIPWPVEDVRPE